jgi:outer membrane protein assembly factor BamE (lipoprotein component of BamABCDE complex)
MKTLIPFFLLAVLLAGCSTIDRRIQEKADAFAGYDAATQEKLRQGIVEIGYTPEQVYIALGKPDDKRERLSKEGRELTWIYLSYHEDYRGTALVGYRRQVAYDPASKRYFVYWEPAVADVYRGRIDERIRISFRDGKVDVIEQTKD